MSFLDAIKNDFESVVSWIGVASRDVVSVALNFGGAFMDTFAHDQLAILSGMAEQAISDVAADPLLVLTPGAEEQALLKYIMDSEFTVVKSLVSQTPALITAALALKHIQLGTPMQTVVQTVEGDGVQAVLSGISSVQSSVESSVQSAVFSNVSSLSAPILVASAVGQVVPNGGTAQTSPAVTVVPNTVVSAPTSAGS